jgi:cellulose synthase/poly-beta-1,6-N-acetylglucosamine synthase-like glycosyltransferase
MAILIVLLAIPSSLIVLIHLTMYIGVIIARIRERGITPQSCEGRIAPNVTASVIVPARNEEQLLPRLLDSLSAQTHEEFSIVLVNDRSTDKTGSIMDAYAAKLPDRVRVIHIESPPKMGNSKLNALVHGTADVESTCILFTDADCIVPAGWVDGMIDTFGDSRVGLVLGPIETLRSGRLLSRFHAFDHIFKYSYNAGCAGVGQATGGFGNNLGVRTEALHEVGGMSALSLSVTEDAALVTALRESTSWSIRARFDRSITVQTEPQPGIRELTRQEVRWHTGGLFSPDLLSRSSYRTLMFYLTLSILIVPFGVFAPVLVVPSLVSFVTMSGMAFFSGLFTRQPLRHHWFPFLPFMIFSMLYNAYLTISAMLRPKIVWKGETLTGYRGHAKRRDS